MATLTTVANLVEEIDKIETSGTKMIITTNLKGVSLNFILIETISFIEAIGHMVSTYLLKLEQ